jgi:hypothetical protein
MEGSVAMFVANITLYRPALRVIFKHSTMEECRANRSPSSNPIDNDAENVPTLFIEPQPKKSNVSLTFRSEKTHGRSSMSTNLGVDVSRWSYG